MGGAARTARAILATAAVVALAAVATSPLVAHSQDGGRETFTVKTVDNKTQETEIDADGDGTTEGVGDYFVGTAPLFRGSEKVGSERHICTVMKASSKGFMMRCEGTFNIEDRGSLEVAGILKFGRRGEASTLTVTGGTAGFRGASGTVKFESARNATLFTFKVN